MTSGFFEFRAFQIGWFRFLSSMQDPKAIWVMFVDGSDLTVLETVACGMPRLTKPMTSTSKRHRITLRLRSRSLDMEANNAMFTLGSASCGRYEQAICSNCDGAKRTCEELTVPSLLALVRLNRLSRFTVLLN